MDFRSLKLYKIPIIFAVGCLAFYASFAYDLARTDFIKLIGLYGALFFLSFKLIQLQKYNFWFLGGLAVIFRLVFLFSFPNLSQDYFRFIWDGRLIASGWNPYQFIPKEIMEVQDFYIPQAQKLIEGMGSLSAGHYSNYPPFSQLIFALAGWLSTSNILGAVVFFRLIIVAADIGTLYFGSKLLKALGIPQYRIFWYILNPFIIIELTGNLHFEAIMVFLLVWALYLLHRRKWVWSALLFGLSVSVKLLPLLFLPLFSAYFTRKSGRIDSISSSVSDDREKSRSERRRGVFNLKKLLVYYLIVGAIVIISFFPFYSEEVILNFFSSVGLWFNKFEFNASIYYIVRWIGFQVKDYNIIETAGKILPLITIGIILYLSFFRKNRTTEQLITHMLFAVTAYLFLSTTVHPWYLAIPLLLSIFTKMKYMIVWSAVVMLSYFAYSNPGYQENLWLVALEYLVVAGFMLKESSLVSYLKN